MLRYENVFVGILCFRNPLLIEINVLLGVATRHATLNKALDILTLVFMSSAGSRGESELSEAPVGLERGEMWKILVETVHALPMYKNHKRYVEEVMIKENAQISPQELAVQLNIPLGEAMVLLREVRGDKSVKSETVQTGIAKSSDRTLMDYNG